MHSTGGEVRCEQCGKMVKNKWYLRRHKVTHHGAPLRKYKKENELRQMDSDNEEGDHGGCQLVIQQWKELALNSCQEKKLSSVKLSRKIKTYGES